MYQYQTFDGMQMRFTVFLVWVELWIVDMSASSLGSIGWMARKEWLSVRHVVGGCPSAANGRLGLDAGT